MAIQSYFTIRFIAWIAFVTIVAGASHNSFAAEPTKVAFLVGVSTYDKAGLRNLKYAENDATDLATELKKAGFTVKLMLGSGKEKDRATVENLRTQLSKDFVTSLKKLNRSDLVVIAFAGHGVQRMVKRGETQGEEPFFCPVDCVVNDDTNGSFLSINDLMDSVGKVSGSENNIFLIDACRDNPSRGRGIDGNRVTHLYDNMAVLYGASSGTQSYESDELKHGLLTHYLLEGLRGKAKDEDGEINLQNLVGYTMKSIDRNARRLVKEDQKPNFISNIRGTPPVLTRITINRTAELEAWAKLHPNEVSSEQYQILGKSAAQSDTSRALVYFNSAASLNPQLPSGTVLLANALAQLQYDHFRKISQLHTLEKLDADQIRERDTANAEEKRLAKIIKEMYLKAMSETPEQTPSVNRRAMASLSAFDWSVRTGDFEFMKQTDSHANKLYKDWIGWKPKSATLEFVNKNYERAEEHFEEFLKQSPNDFHAVEGLVWTLIAQKDPQKLTRALKLAERNLANSKNQGVPEHYVANAEATLAWVAIQQNDLKSAKEYMTRLQAKGNLLDQDHINMRLIVASKLPEMSHMLNWEGVKKDLTAVLKMPGIAVFRAEAEELLQEANTKLAAKQKSQEQIELGKSVIQTDVNKALSYFTEAANLDPQLSMSGTLLTAAAVEEVRRAHVAKLNQLRLIDNRNPEQTEELAVAAIEEKKLAKIIKEMLLKAMSEATDQTSSELRHTRAYLEAFDWSINNGELRLLAKTTSSGNQFFKERNPLQWTARMAKKEFLDKRYERAEKLLEECLQQVPNDFPVTELLVWSLVAQKDPQKMQRASELAQRNLASAEKISAPEQSVAEANMTIIWVAVNRDDLQTAKKHWQSTVGKRMSYNHLYFSQRINLSHDRKGENLESSKKVLTEMLTGSGSYFPFKPEAEALLEDVNAKIAAKKK